MKSDNMLDATDLAASNVSAGQIWQSARMWYGTAASDVGHIPIERQRGIQCYAEKLNGIAECDSCPANIKLSMTRDAWQFYSTETLSSIKHDRFSFAWVQ